MFSAAGHKWLFLQKSGGCAKLHSTEGHERALFQHLVIIPAPAAHSGFLENKGQRQ